VLGRACAWLPSVLWMRRGMGMEWGGGFVVVDWAGVVLQDVLYGGDFCIVIIFL
jgi:hypothetical protein